MTSKKDENHSIIPPRKKKKKTTMSSPLKIKAQPYDWPLNEPMSAETTALVVIDMQADCKS